MNLIYVCAAHSCGKSTLLDLFTKVLDRQDLSYDRNASPRTLVPTDKLYTGVDDVSQFFITFGTLSDILKCKKKFYITDRYLVDNIAYASSSDAISDQLLNIHFDFLNYFSPILEPLVFYLPLEIALERDGVRPADLKFREKIDTKIRNLLDQHIPDYTVLSGNPEERLLKMIGRLRKMGITL